VSEAAQDALKKKIEDATAKETDPKKKLALENKTTKLLAKE